MRTNIVTSDQIARCPTHRLDAQHWIDVPPGGTCRCLCMVCHRRPGEVAAVIDGRIGELCEKCYQISEDGRRNEEDA